MRLPQEYKRRARIEIIPLIDIIFFLLATFVMVSLSMIKNQGVFVKLPKAATGLSQERSLSSTITVKKNGDLFLNKEKILPRDLFRNLEELKKTDPGQKIFLNGDEQAYFGNIVSVLDRVRAVGIEKVSIQTKGAGSSASGSQKSSKSKPQNVPS